jgi:uncharacterized protein (DUF488 family)
MEAIMSGNDKLTKYPKADLPVYARQKFLLSFVQSLESGVTATELQKLTFLYLNETDNNYYDYVPYKFGCYSFQMTEDVSTLLAKGFLSDKEGKITPSENHKKIIMKFSGIESKRSDSLIRKVYSAYPYYAINSTILDRVFRTQPQEIQRIKQTKNALKKDDTKLFTVGYEGKTIEKFTNDLIVEDVRVLCDVRKNPLSRKFGFSKNKLSHILEQVGIRYVHIPELGIESDKRASLETKADYVKLFNSYKQTLPQRKEYLDVAKKLIDEESRVALMCFEKDPEFCHRHVIRDYLINKYAVECGEL